MRIHSATGAIIAVCAAAMLTLSACSSAPKSPQENPADKPVVEIEAPADSSTDNSSNANTKGLSQEAIDQGFTVVKMPDGWPSDLPLPEGNPVSALRSGESFSLVFDLASVEAGNKIIDWYKSKGWTIESDFETDVALIIEFGSPETSDYGPIRRVTLGLGMNGWPTGFQYLLDVQE